MLEAPIPRSLYIILVYFTIWGLCSTPNPNSPFRRYLLECLSLAHMLLITIQSVIVIIWHNLIFASTDSFGKLNDMQKLSGVVVACTVIIVESYARRHQQWSFWTNILQINDEDASKYSNERHGPIKPTYWLIFAFYHVLVFMIELSWIPIASVDKQSLNYWAVYLGMLMMCRTRFLQYFLYVQILETHIVRLQLEMQTIVEHTKLLMKHQNGTELQCSLSKYLCARIKWAQRRYQMLYELSMSLNDIFGWSQLANILHSFMHMIADLYWAYWRFFDQTNYR